MNQFQMPGAMPVSQPFQQLLPDDQQAQMGQPAAFNAGPPPEFTAPYTDEEKLNPRALMFAGLLSDMGGYLASGGMRPMGNTGLNMFMQAQKYNAGQKAANQAAQQKHYQQQMAYQKQMQDQAHRGQSLGLQERGIARQEASDLANKQYRDATLGHGEDRLALDWERHNLNADAQNAAALALAEAGVPMDVVKQETTEQQNFIADTKPLRDMLKRAQDAKALLAQGTGIGDLTGIISVIKALDPTSVVSQGETDNVQKVQSWKEELISRIEKGQGKGTLTAETIADINRALDSVINVASADYKSRENDVKRRFESYDGVMDAERFLPTNPFQTFYKSQPNLVEAPAQTVEIPQVPTSYGQVPQVGPAQLPNEVMSKYGLTPR